ncbi:MAG: nucleotidyltransferase domain-containing protein [Candidatus Woesearchaeota archaeon]|nr:MAG: nucleotidyltransferase domain-containing protein [Candidatus Woesearchaeota archaeon]
MKRSMHTTAHKHDKEAITLAYEFAKHLHREVHDFVKAIVLFGSQAKSNKPGHDIDLLIVVDDVAVHIDDETAEAYRIIVEKIMLKVSKRLHVTTLRFTSFWEYVRSGDPVAMNMLRDGLPLIDTGFFEPLQLLLKQGRIFPSEETMWLYLQRAKNSLQNSQKRIGGALVDLYWGVVDAAHAALMRLNVSPPSPLHIPALLEKEMVAKSYLTKADVELYKTLYAISKRVEQGRNDFRSSDFEELSHKAKLFVEKIDHFLSGRP